jgi:pyridoxamine 5'-phosphate oxidase
MKRTLPSIPRREFASASLQREDLADDPLDQFVQWLSDAVDTGVEDPHAMTLATAGADGIPSARVVLLKNLDDRGFSFISHYNGPKGRDLCENPRATLLFFWPKLERQVRISGTVSKTSREESLQLFRERPLGSQVAVLVGHQSEVIENREFLDNSFQELMQKYKDGNVPLPETWGGYILTPTALEFWQGGVNRLHDRFLYHQQADNSWNIDRLAP